MRIKFKVFAKTVAYFCAAAVNALLSCTATLCATVVLQMTRMLSVTYKRMLCPLCVHTHAAGMCFNQCTQIALPACARVCVLAFKTKQNKIKKLLPTFARQTKFRTALPLVREFGAEGHWHVLAFPTLFVARFQFHDFFHIFFPSFFMRFPRICSEMSLIEFSLFVFPFLQITDRRELSVYVLNEA